MNKENRLLSNKDKREGTGDREKSKWILSLEEMKNIAKLSNGVVK